MKAPKISLDAAKLQQLLLLHVEKIVLGIVVLAVLWFVYQGATLEGLDPDKTNPDKLAATSNGVITEINNPAHKDPIIKERDPKHPVQALVTQGQIANVAKSYELPNPWKTPDYPKAIQRIDPRHFPPNKPIATPLYGPIAMYPAMNEVDPILAIEVAAPAEGRQPTQPPAARQPTRQPRGEGGRQPRAPRGPGGPGGEGLLEGGFGEGPGFGEMGPRAGMPGAQGDRRLPPEAIVGFRLGGSDVIAKEGKAVVVMASVPFEKQMEEYEKAFKEALDYDPERDLPRYILFRIERADVTDDPEIDPAQATWKSLGVAEAMRNMALWGPSPNEIVELNAIDPILTHRVPPFLQRDLYDVMVHPDIPRAQLVAAEGPGGVEGQPRPGVVPPNAPTNDDDLLNPGAVRPGSNPGVEGAGPGRGMREGFRQPPGGYPGAMRQPGMMMPRGGYGEGGFAGGAPQEMKLAKFKLVRFTDTTVEPLRKYRYRIKLLFEDPNNPYAGEAPSWDPGRTAPLRKPSVQSMSANVIQRVKTAETSGGKYPFLLESEPSEPSDIVELPAANRYFAGKATPGGGSALRQGTPIIYTSQPTANLLTVEWDTTKAVDVPGEKEVFRGSTLNFEKEVDVIHPAVLVIHPIGKYSFRNNSLVLDFAGGNEIPSVDGRRSDNKVQEPCEILIVDGSGNLQILDETDDVEGFRRYLPPKVEAPKTPGPGEGFGPNANENPGGLLDGPRAPVRPRGGGKPGQG
jgi:hypothetical protein